MGYKEEVLRDSPIGYWRLNETSGTTAADSSGNSRSGTISGTVTLNQSGSLLDDSSPSILFSGGWVHIPDAQWIDDLVTAANHTYEFWLYPGSTATLHIFGRSASSIYVVMNHVAAKTFSWYDGSGTDADALEVSNVLETNAWSHVVLVRRGTTMEMWINGTMVGSRTFATQPAASGQDLGIGWDSSGSSISGRMQDVAVYDHALPGDRIISHYTEGRQRGYEDEVFKDVPLSMWRLNDPAGASLKVADRFGRHDGLTGGSPQYPGASSLNLLPSDAGGRALDFSSGTNPLVNLGGWNMGTDDFAVECLFRPTSLVRSVIVAQGTSYGSNTRYGLVMAATGLLSWNVGVNGIGNVAANQASGALAVGSTYHIVGERSGANVNLYVNGVLVAQNTGAGAGATFSGGGQTHYMGYDGTNSPGGHVQELAMYLAALGVTAARRHYAARLLPPRRAVLVG